jgi:hypothetical protein
MFGVCGCLSPFVGMAGASGPDLGLAPCGLNPDRNLSVDSRRAGYVGGRVGTDHVGGSARFSVKAGTNAASLLTTACRPGQERRSWRPARSLAREGGRGVMSRLSAPHRAFHRCGCCGTRGTGSTGKGAYMQAKCPQGVPLAGSRCCALAAPRCMKQESRRWTAHYCLCVWREATTPTSTPITKGKPTSAPSTSEATPPVQR